MAKTNEFVQHVIEMMEDFGAVSARAMFGGYGIYHVGLMFGLVADDELYLKVDATNEPRFVAEDLGPFMYVKNGKSMPMSYFRAPEASLDSRDVMTEWATLGYEAALRAKKK